LTANQKVLEISQFVFFGNFSESVKLLGVLFKSVQVRKLASDLIACGIGLLSQTVDQTPFGFLFKVLF
jgi:hypothetical protein